MYPIIIVYIQFINTNRNEGHTTALRFQEGRHHDVIDTQRIHSELATNIH